MEEQIDIFNANYEYIGIDTRSNAHKKGLWHHCFHCWIVRPNNNLLIQLRGKDKQHNPNKLDVSVAGHIGAGENMKDGGLRELKEELGIHVDFEKLISVGWFKWARDNVSKNYFNRAFYSTFFLKDDTQLDKYIMQPEEVDAIFEINIDDGRKLFSNEINFVEITGFLRENKKEIKKEITKNDFVEFTPYYWLKIFNLTEDINNNRKYLSI
jgi:isopentenyldiphosphate isomerase